MTKEKQEKSCENCMHYVAHYIKRETSFYYIHSGHCRLTNEKKLRKKIIDEYCELWEVDTTIKEERKKAILATLTSMSERLHEIALILKDDNN